MWLAEYSRPVRSFNLWASHSNICGSVPMFLTAIDTIA